MTDDAEGLHLLSPTGITDSAADVVFVHGIAGGSHATWRHGKRGEAGHFFWPEELARERPHCRVWTIGYAAGISQLGNPGMIIDVRAGNIVNQMTLKGIGERPLVFVTHSMGGLIVKSLIVSADLQPNVRWKALVRHIRAIVFCGTPHRGSDFATAAGILGAFFGGAQNHVAEMAANGDALDLLNDRFVHWYRANPIAVESYAEKIGLFRKRWFLRPLPLGVVVPRTSANPGIGEVFDVDADHLALVKPSPGFAPIYTPVFMGVLRLLDDVTRPKASSNESRVSPSLVRAVLTWLDEVLAP